jgi:5'-nucleotidase
MKIMLVNDDGYRAQGLLTLGRALIKRGHSVTVCAPDRERSGASHSFTILNPLKARAFSMDGLEGFAIDGTPSDCAHLGLYMLENDVDMTISGINNGANMGGACVYSGTVAGAMEAAMCGCQALATSLNAYGASDFEAAARVTVAVAEWAAEHPLPRGEIYNLNVPDAPYEKIKGVKRATLAQIFLGDAKYEKRRAPYGFDYYWLMGGENVPVSDPESDVALCGDGWATISPLSWNMLSGTGMASPEVKL